MALTAQFCYFWAGNFKTSFITTINHIKPSNQITADKLNFKNALLFIKIVLVYTRQQSCFDLKICKDFWLHLDKRDILPIFISLFYPEYIFNNNGIPH